VIDWPVCGSGPSSKRIISLKKRKGEVFGKEEDNSIHWIAWGKHSREGRAGSSLRGEGEDSRKHSARGGIDYVSGNRRRYALKEEGGRTRFKYVREDQPVLTK